MIAWCAVGAADEYKPPVGPANFAHVVYEAIGNVELDEGTVEIWVRSDFDPQSRISNRFYLPMCYCLTNNLFDELDAAGAEFHPYYKHKPFIRKATPPHILCTVYLHRGEKAIVILANIEDQDVAANVQFDWEQFGLAGKNVDVRDGLLPDAVFARDGDGWVVPILPQRYRILVIKKVD